MSRPSLISRFTSWVRSQPLSPWSFYLALLATWVLYDLFAYSLAGGLPPGSWSARDIYDVFGGAFFSVAVLAFYFYLDQEIGEAADESRQISGLTDAQFARMRHELIVIPLWPNLLVGLASGIGAVQAAMFERGVTTISLPLVPYLLDWFLTSAIGFGLAFRVVRLIFLTGKLYAGPIRLNVFNLPPLHELSTVVGKAGLFLLVLWYLYLPLSLDEFILGSPAALTSGVLVALVPLAAFIVPHAVLGRRLSHEKTRLMVDVSLQLQSAFQQFNDELHARRLDQVELLRAAIDTLVAQRKFIEGIPTWPWRLATFRVAVTAVLLPVVVWLIQQLLTKFITI